VRPTMSAEQLAFSAALRRVGSLDELDVGNPVQVRLGAVTDLPGGDLDQVAGLQPVTRQVVDAHGELQSLELLDVLVVLRLAIEPLGARHAGPGALLHTSWGGAARPRRPAARLFCPALLCLRCSDSSLAPNYTAGRARSLHGFLRNVRGGGSASPGHAREAVEQVVDAGVQNQESAERQHEGEE